MKKLIIAFALLFSVPALANYHPHWALVGAFNNATTRTYVYLDDARVIEEDGYTGFNIMTFFETPFEATDGTKLGTVFSVFEVNCVTGEGRGRRSSFLDLQGNEFEASDKSWKAITGPPASQTIDAVKQRVCFTKS